MHDPLCRNTVQSSVAPVIVPLNVVGIKPPTNEEHHSLKIRLPKNGSGPSLVITSTPAPAASNAAAVAATVTSEAAASAVAAVTSTPHHKKVPKRSRILQNESDGHDMDTEEEEDGATFAFDSKLANQTPTVVLQKAQPPKKKKTTSTSEAEAPLQFDEHEKQTDVFDLDHDTDQGGKATPDSQITNDDRQA